MMISRPCAYCGKPCPPQPHQGQPRKWCSRTCTDRARRERQCEDCGTQYSGTSSFCPPCRRRRTWERRAKRRAAKRRDYGQAECRICQVVFVKSRPNQVYCSTECRNSRRTFTYAKVASAAERGYGTEHRRERERWKPIVAAGDATCCLCGEWIEPDSKWHLDHNDDRTGYRGVAHAICNMRDGARRGNRAMPRPKMEKICEGCQHPFATIYPRQRFCSNECKPPRPVARQRTPRWCADCGTSIPRGKRCPDCRVEWNREVYQAHRVSMRNAYRERVGIPIEAPLYTRAS